jgi:hypothetical protein
MFKQAGNSFSSSHENAKGASAALAACKADWAKARAHYGHARLLGEEFILDMFNATNDFLGSRRAREAFRGGWTMKELFGVTLEMPYRFGLVCAAVNATLAIVDFDGAWVFVNARAIASEDAGDALHRYIRADFQYPGSVPWWRHPTYTRTI